MEDPAPAVVGWCERIDFPDWDLRRVRAKIDTGARTSALGVLYHGVTEVEGGTLVADLTIAIDRTGTAVTVRAKFLGMVHVKNSCGVEQERPLIEAVMRLGPVTEAVRFTVTDRSAMRFPVILGRTALSRRFVVDVSQKYVWKRSGRKRTGRV